MRIFAIALSIYGITFKRLLKLQLFVTAIFLSRIGVNNASARNDLPCAPSRWNHPL